MDYVYMLRCADGTYYTGWTNNLTKRLQAHNSGKGAKYTAHRAPVELVFSEIFDSKSEALGYEYALKQLSRAQKEQVIATQNDPDAEYLTVLDGANQPRGVRPRAQVHRQNLRHAVVHLWVLEQRGKEWFLWLQQRAPDRVLYPSSYDLSATGHIDAGETPVQAVLREAHEEIGLQVSAEQLHALAQSRQQYARGDGGFDDEVVHTFVYCTAQTPSFCVGEEVVNLRAMPLKTYAKAVKGDAEIQWEGQTVASDLLCCRHKQEWAKVRKLLREMK